MAWLERLILTYQAEMVDDLSEQEVNEVAFVVGDVAGVHQTGGRAGAWEKEIRDVEVTVRDQG